MQWQDIIRRDPYLAGSIAARSYEWWRTEGGPDETAKECGLLPEEPAYAEFLRGWADELKDVGIDELQRAVREQQEMLKRAEEKGDSEGW